MSGDPNNEISKTWSTQNVTGVHVYIYNYFGRYFQRIHV